MGQGSLANIIAALASFFIAGLGQLLQGRVLWAVFWLVLAASVGVITWLVTLFLLPFGWHVVAVLSCIHAAVYSPRA